MWVVDCGMDGWSADRVSVLLEADGGSEINCAVAGKRSAGCEGLEFSRFCTKKLFDGLWVDVIPRTSAGSGAKRKLEKIAFALKLLPPVAAGAVAAESGLELNVASGGTGNVFRSLITELFARASSPVS